MKCQEVFKKNILLDNFGKAIQNSRKEELLRAKKDLYKHADMPEDADHNIGPCRAVYCTHNCRHERFLEPQKTDIYLSIRTAFYIFMYISGSRKGWDE